MTSNKEEPKEDAAWQLRDRTLTEAEAAELDAFKDRPSRLQGKVLRRQQTVPRFLAEKSRG